MPKKAPDLCGKRFGKLTVIGESPEKYIACDGSRTEPMWTCRCECGNTLNVRASYLKKGNKKSCGCLRKKVYPRNIIGLKFGSLTVIDYDTSRDTRHGTVFICECECGRTVSVFRSNLISGATKTCGHYCRFSTRYRLTTLTADQAKAQHERWLRKKQEQEEARLKCQDILGVEIDRASNVVHLNCDMQDFTPDNLWFTKNASTLNQRLNQFPGLGFRNNDDGSFITDTHELMSCALMLFKLQDIIRVNGGII